MLRLLALLTIPCVASAQVPGLADTTSRARVTHALTVVDSARLRATNHRSVADALAATVPGASVITIEGTPGSAPFIVLRGAAVQGVTNPLVVIDGVISRGPLEDLNADDVERIEVVRGPAAAAAYGVGAANGVIRVFTRRGRDLGSPDTRVTVRSELSSHLRPRILPINRHHAFQLDASGNFVLNGNGDRVAEPDGINDNTYPRTYDAPDALLDRRVVLTNHVTAQHFDPERIGGLFASLRHERDPGMLRLLSGYDEKAARLTLDRAFGTRLTVDGGAFFLSTDSDLPPRQGDLLSTLRFVEPHGKLDSLFTPCPIAEGCYTPLVPVGRLGATLPNPLSIIQSWRFDDSRRRIRAGINASYRITEWLSARAGFTADRARSRASSVATLTGDPETIVDGQDRLSFGSVVVTATRTLPRAILTTTRVGWSRERTFRSSTTMLPQFPFAGFSLRLSGVTPSLFATTELDIGSKVIVTGAVRRDEPSFFGESDATTYHRLGVAYRPFERVGFHAAHGTGGVGIPDSTAFSFGISPASSLRPPFVRETELGTSLSLGGVSVGYDFATQRSVGHILIVPTPATIGFVSMLTNAGDVTTRSHELSFGGELLSGADRSWRVDLIVQRARSVMSRLRVPAFFRSGAAMFLVEQGRELNMLAGTRWIRTEAQLLETISTGQLSGAASDYVRNEEGYYVRATQHRTPSEMPLVYARCTQQSGSTCSAFQTVFDLGRTTPDVALGLMSSARWRALSLSATVGSALGGMIYNGGRRVDILRERDVVVDQSQKAVVERKPGAYYRAFLGTGLPSEYLVESATHVKLRDVSLDWRLRGRYRVGVVARNLWTFGSYDGHDADVAVPSSNLFDRNVALFQYPASRTVGAVVRAAF